MPDERPIDEARRRLDDQMRQFPEKKNGYREYIAAPNQAARILDQEPDD